MPITRKCIKKTELLTINIAHNIYTEYISYTLQCLLQTYIIITIYI